jgi:hypothetical protein
MSERYHVRILATVFFGLIVLLLSCKEQPRVCDRISVRCKGVLIQFVYEAVATHYPTNANTTILVEVPKTSKARLSIYEMLGR